MAATAHTAELDGEPLHWWAAEGPGAPVLYVHGVPDSGDVWLPFLERTGGLAPDLPGFGRSGKGGHREYSIAAYDRFVERFLAHVGVDRVRLVVHDWGCVGLAWAQRFPERVERLVVIDAVPLLPGYRWHRVARRWRTRGVGELLMGFTNQLVMRRGVVASRAMTGPPAREWAQGAARHFDQGTQRAILRLYRAGDEPVLAAAGERLGAITAPALVLWGEHDPYIRPRFAQAYAEALGGETTVEVVPGAGHWPWLDDPLLVGRIAAFLAGDPPAA